ncbi:2'-5' RNA ligase family protein [Streptococcus ovis]|uniref:2'-5' RNA ligase family protein n=1 Tax=Streptococcus ovis TaxID=82806 RepID=UPI00037B5C12|nr:2'-5' RNA ligase family protein [Streptococcus ovis]
MYAVILTFDEQIEDRIKKIWQELEEQGISDYASQVQNRKPHLTLASYEEIANVEVFEKQFNLFYRQVPSLTVQFSSLGSFLQSATLFLSPVVTQSLFVLHQAHYQTFHQWSAQNLYSPEHWIPHVTLANYLSADQLQEAFAFCQGRLSNLEGCITGVQLIEISKDKQVKTVFHIEFQ